MAGGGESGNGGNSERRREWTNEKNVEKQQKEHLGIMKSRELMSLNIGQRNIEKCFIFS